MKKLIKDTLWRVGIDIRKAKYTHVLDFTKKNIDPISALYQSDGLPFFIRVPLKDCCHCGIMSFSCRRKDQSIYTRTLVEYIKGECITYSGSWLEKVHLNFQPKNAAEFIGIENPSFSGFKFIEPRGGLLPWTNLTPEQKLEIRKKTDNNENKENGKNINYDLGGDRYFGPTSKEKGELEFNRLVNLYNNIKKNGYIKNIYGNHNIEANILLSDHNKKPHFFVSGGHHRMAVLVALGYEYVDIQVRSDFHNGIIRREDVNYWPAIHNGYLNRDEALTLFDRVYEGEPPISFKRAMQLKDYK